MQLTNITTPPPLDMMNQQPFLVPPRTDASYKKSLTGVGEISVQLKNATGETKYFFFAITETDAEGWPLNEMKPSEAEMATMERRLAAEKMPAESFIDFVNKMESRQA